MKKVWPPLVLFLLAPVIGELLSGFTPPSEFFAPVGFLALAVLYGGGALLVRELVIRWGKGWYSIILMGAAFGIVKEGLMTKSFYDPTWLDMDILGYYGRWEGVSWIWSIELTVYHAFISIAIPILLAEIVFPAVRRERWLGREMLTVVAVCFTGNVAFGSIFLSEYDISIVKYLLAVLSIIALVLAARLYPHREKDPLAAGNKSVKNPLLFWLTGFSAMICFVVIFWVLPDFEVLPLVIIILAVLMLAGYFWLIRRLSGSFMVWGNIHQLALAAGPLTFLMIFVLILEINPNRADDTTGMTIVGVVALVLLVLLFWKTIRRMRVTENE